MHCNTSRFSVPKCNRRPSPAFVASSRHMGRSDTGEANEGASLRAGKTAVAGGGIGGRQMPPHPHVSILFSPGQKVGAGLADEEDRASTAVEACQHLVFCGIMSTRFSLKLHVSRAPRTMRKTRCFRPCPHRSHQSRVAQRTDEQRDRGLLSAGCWLRFLQEPSLCGCPMKWLSLVSLTSLGTAVERGWVGVVRATGSGRRRKMRFQTTGQALLIKWADAQGKKERL